MLNKETLTEINGRSRHSTISTPLAAALAAGVVLATLVAASVSPRLAAGILAAGIVAALVAYVKSRSRSATPLFYDLDKKAAAEFDAVQKACRELANAEKVWVSEPAAGENGLSGDRAPVETGLLETPGISANVDVPGIDAGEFRLHFFPDCVLYCRAGKYRAVSYKDFEVTSGKTRRLEEGEVPQDTEVIDQTWRHVRGDGGPDLRFTSNPKLTTVNYGTLRLSGRGFAVELLVSSRRAASRFARAFGPAPGACAEEEPPRTYSPPVSSGLASPAHAVLGVEAGASKSEVTAAYRKLAREHHPDAVASLDPEAREASESRMKEINAAYAELRRQR